MIVRASSADVFAALVAGGLALVGCGDDGGDGVTAGPLDDFVVLAPSGFSELVPTTTVDVTWAVTAALAYGLELQAVAGATPIMIDRRALAPGTLSWNGRDRAGRPAPPGNYQVRAIALGPDDGEVDTAEGDNAHLIVVQGVSFRDTTLAFTGAPAPRDIVLTTTARSVMELTLVLDPDVATAGDELPLLTATIPGEFASFARSYPFTGRTAADQPIAAGTYVVAAQLRAVAADIAYRVDGPTLTWTP